MIRLVHRPQLTTVRRAERPHDLSELSRPALAGEEDIAVDDLAKDAADGPQIDRVCVESTSSESRPAVSDADRRDTHNRNQSNRTRALERGSSARPYKRRLVLPA